MCCCRLLWPHACCMRARRCRGMHAFVLGSSMLVFDWCSFVNRHIGDEQTSLRKGLRSRQLRLKTVRNFGTPVFIYFVKTAVGQLQCWALWHARRSSSACMGHQE